MPEKITKKLITQIKPGDTIIKYPTEGDPQDTFDQANPQSAQEYILQSVGTGSFNEGENQYRLLPNPQVITGGYPTFTNNALLIKIERDLVEDGVWWLRTNR